jgi:hypothetical protein
VRIESVGQRHVYKADCEHEHLTLIYAAAVSSPVDNDKRAAAAVVRCRQLAYTRRADPGTVRYSPRLVTDEVTPWAVE